MKHPRKLTECLSLTILALFCCVVSVNGAANPFNKKFGDFYGIPGKYCETSYGDRCCDGRQDECSVPILGTRCYCDQFCNRTVNSDCCPDYWDKCLGKGYGYIEGPGTLTLGSPCSLDGKIIADKSEEKDNCNVCSCKDGTLDCTDDVCLIDSDLLENVQKTASRMGWTARNYSRFWGKTAEEGLRMLTGTLHPDKKSLSIHPIHLYYDESLLPEEFDSRSQWPWARIGKVWDQGWCGSSWAFSTASVAENRLAIQSGGKEVVDFSRQNLVSCNRRGQQACQGGHVDRAWNYLRKYGVVSDDCYPYNAGDSEGKLAMCKVPKMSNLYAACKRKDFPMERKEFYKTEPPYRISSKEEDIMWEIMSTGPVQAVMKVYRDFFLYSGGIYTREGLVEDFESSYHSVKIFGWGQESSHYGSPRKYWLCMNSWGELWGERGTFKIRRGANESEIEHLIITSRARLADQKYTNGHHDSSRRRHRRRRNRRRNLG